MEGVHRSRNRFAGLQQLEAKQKTDLQKIQRDNPQIFRAEIEHDAESQARLRDDDATIRRDSFSRSTEVQQDLDMDEAQLQELFSQYAGEDQALDSAEMDRVYEEHARPVHVVESGDSLSAIAAEYTGDAGDWQALYGHGDNQTTVGGDPNLIHPGQELEIPQEFVDTKAVREAQLPEHGELPASADRAAEAAAMNRAEDEQVLMETREAFDRLPPERQEQVRPQMEALEQAYVARHGEEALGRLDAAGATLDEAERLIEQPRYTEAMFAGAPAQQRASEQAALDQAGAAIEALPAGPTREAAQARFDALYTAFLEKHGLEEQAEASPPPMMATPL